jgi:hypothetical protein
VLTWRQRKILGVPPAGGRRGAAGRRHRCRHDRRRGHSEEAKRSGGHAWLVPHNPAYLPILADDATILGTVVALLRRI